MTMSTPEQPEDRGLAAIPPIAPAFSREQIELIKATVAQGTTDEELRLFLYTANRMGLDPLMHQIHAVKRWDAQAQRERMTIQTGIDGYRLIADRTGRYAPGREPTFAEGKDGLVSATAYVKKLVAGTWHEVAATAHWAEYAQRRKDGQPTRSWAQMPHVMLAKCAEALALRRAFPAELGGVYTQEEMQQAEVQEREVQPVQPPAPAPALAREPEAAAQPPSEVAKPPAARRPGRPRKADAEATPLMLEALLRGVDELLADPCFDDEGQRDGLTRFRVKVEGDRDKIMRFTAFLKQLLAEKHCTHDLPF